MSLGVIVSCLPVLMLCLHVAHDLLMLIQICTVELQHNLRQSVQHTEAAVEAQQSSVLKIGKGMQELHRLLSVKADKGDVDQCILKVLCYVMDNDVGATAILAQMDKHLRNLESRFQENYPKESGAIVNFVS